MAMHDMAGHLIRRLQQQSTQIFAQRTQAAGYDLTSVQYAALDAIANNPHVDQASVGNIKGIPPGDVQRMSAGSGVQHSEFNHAPDETTHFFQIWIEPNVRGIPASYEQRQVPPVSKRGALSRIAAPEDAVVKIHADAALYAGLFDGDEAATLDIALGRKAYVHLIRGSLQVNGVALAIGDAALLDNEPSIHLTHGQDAEVLVFDLAP
jgi:redox-sensitive bicupin YhaK (pirin superfamily)